MSPVEFHTHADYQAALDALIVAAQWRLRLYDATLEMVGLDEVTRYQQLRAFCLGNPQRRIEILLDDPTYVQTHCPRLMNLLRDFTHVLEIRQTEARASAPPTRLYSPTAVGGLGVLIKMRCPASGPPTMRRAPCCCIRHLNNTGTARSPTCQCRRWDWLKPPASIARPVPIR